MAAYSRAAIRRFLKAADEATTHAAKGKAFENLICYLFERIPGITITQRNIVNRTESEEIDIALWNEGHPRGLRSFPSILLVECKNWSSPVGSMEVMAFISKIEARGLDCGLLFAASGITGSAEDGRSAHHMVSLALARKVRIVVISRAEVERLRQTDDLTHLIKTKLCQLIASGTVWP